MKIVVATDDRQPIEKYRGALLCAGALPEEIVIVRPESPLPQEFDGLLISGGADVDPSRYGETSLTDTLDLMQERDALDFGLYAESQRLNAPVLGICRGLQMLNVALGGTLWQDLESQRDRGLEHEYSRREWDPAHPAHEVRPVSRRSSELAQIFSSAGVKIVNSRHHQAVKDLAEGLAPLAASPDDLVEAFERNEGPFLAAVQWHPEDLVAQPLEKALFRLFLSKCRARSMALGLKTPPIEVTLEGRIPVVTLNRPAKRNAFGGTMREMLAGTIEALGGDPTVPAIILTGAGGAFSAGGDLEVLRALVDAKDVEGFRELLLAGAAAVLAIARSPVPVIAAIDGPAAGAGMNLALACDVRIASASEGFEASFVQSFALIGLSPDWGGTYHLPILAGPGKAADLIFSAEKISARRALELGLVDFLAEDGSALPHALRRASMYAERSSVALAAAKKNLNAERLPRLEEALARESEAQLELFQSGELARRLNPKR